MAETTAYRIGRALRRVPISIYLIVLGTASAYFLWSGEKVSTPTPAQVEKANSISEEKRCRNEREALLTTYQEKVKAGLPWQAVLAIRPCAVRLNDAEMLELVRLATIEDRIKIAVDKNAPLPHRLSSIEKVEEMDPAEGEKLSKVKAQVSKEIERQAAASKRAEAARKRSEGVSIGMSQEDVLASSWGKPTRINKTIHSFGVHEQWVYEGRNYLYFKNGVLDSIQTGQ